MTTQTFNNDSVGAFNYGKGTQSFRIEKKTEAIQEKEKEETITEIFLKLLKAIAKKFKI